MNLKETKMLLKQLQISPKKQLGQNFLVHSLTAQKIADEVKKCPSPWMEVGPGLGALTQFFGEDKSLITLVEKDKKIAQYWESKGFHTLCKDALKISWEDLQKITLFGNLPYEIASPIILKACQFQSKIPNMVLMIQKEVSERVQSKNKSKKYSLLSVMAQTFWKIHRIQVVEPKKFYPIPKVAGHTLVFTAKNTALSATDFLKFLKACFLQKRKILYKKIPFLTHQKALQLLLEMNFNQNTRAEELSPEDFVCLFKKIKSNIESCP